MGLLMIINNFHIRRAGRRPAKADAKLVVYSDAMLSFSVSY